MWVITEQHANILNYSLLFWFVVSDLLNGLTDNPRFRVRSAYYLIWSLHVECQLLELTHLHVPLSSRICMVDEVGVTSIIGYSLPTVKALFADVLNVL